MTDNELEFQYRTTFFLRSPLINVTDIRRKFDMMISLELNDNKSIPLYRTYDIRVYERNDINMILTIDV